MNFFSLEGHVALVTGSSTGLGKGIARVLGAAGAKVVLNYANNVARAEQAREELAAEQIDCLLHRADVTNEGQIDEMFRAAESTYGPIDIIVVNATPDQPQLPIEQYDWEFHQSMLDFFVKSPYLLTRRALPSMRQQKWGRIVNITSEVYHRSVAPFSAYVAAKGAQIGWTRSMATELAPHGITVNSVAPGWIPVERHEKDPQEMKDAYFSIIPMGRWGTPEDVGYAVLFYASEQASFVTGQTTCVNGGNTPW
ncbi:MAG: SDR family oxidoreductase [Planctomycetales bacterium]|nr:SDR family oxidoreductase [Planctomycetales bacterium]MCA9166790.1 SDR family oxidoreductase [Planctomycetales bacterium]